MSGGEQQRIAIAIALSNKPRLLLADEPTGSVDTKTATDIMTIFRRLQTEQKQTIVIVTHDMQLSRQVSRVVAIRDGKTSSEYRSILRPNLRPASTYAGQNGEADDEPDAASAQELVMDGIYDTENSEPNEENTRFGKSSHQELAVVDRAGRLQIPHEYLKSLGIDGKGMIRVELEDGHIVLYPSEHGIS